MTHFTNTRIFMALLTSVLVAALIPTAATGQGRTFTNDGVDYVIEFPSASWRGLGPSDLVPARTRKEFIYANGDGVRLTVRRKMVGSSVTPTDMARWRRHSESQLPGYVTVKEERLTGHLSGVKFSYEYTQGGKPMAALAYYFEADSRTIYSLLFTGTRDELQGLRDQTDSIARSFRLKKTVSAGEG